MAFAEDLSPFFSTADFAVAVTSGARSFRAIFDRSYVDPLGVASGEPMITCASQDAPAVGDSITVVSQTFTVATVEPDGTGVTVCRLQR